MPIRTLIVEDEAYARSDIEGLVQEEPRLQWIGSAEDGQQALIAIREQNPELILMDIKMPDLSGIEVARQVQAVWSGEIVFVTAYDQHAVAAFDLHAVDYLLKPVQPDRFKTAVDRVWQRSGAMQKAIWQRVLSFLPRSPRHSVTTVDGTVHWISTDDLIWIEAADHYIFVHTRKSTLSTRDTLSRWQKQLGLNAYRLDRSALVMLHAIERIEPWSRHRAHVILANNHVVSASRKKANDLERHLDQVGDFPRRD